ncbi:MAG TPA: hypothetical protein VFJ51_08615 [Nitrososphaeraceae archaeon]|nr:hypothetical protein [Nitrososphaeraceae archaeon]
MIDNPLNIKCIQQQENIHLATDLTEKVFLQPPGAMKIFKQIPKDLFRIQQQRPLLATATE